MSRGNKLDYLYIRAWEQIMHSHSYYLNRQLETAREEHAPETAIYKDFDTGEWATFEGIENDRAKARVQAIVRRLEGQNEKV